MPVVSQPIGHAVLAPEPAKPTCVVIGYFQPTDIEICKQQATQVDASAVDRAKFAGDYATTCRHVSSIGQRGNPTVVQPGDCAHLKALQAEPTFWKFAGPGGSIQLVKVLAFMSEVGAKIGKAVAIYNQFRHPHAMALAAYRTTSTTEEGKA